MTWKTIRSMVMGERMMNADLEAYYDMRVICIF